MATEVKICGIRTIGILEAALAHGAEYVGLVFFPASPRNLSLDEAASLARRASGRARVVALTVDAGDRLLDDIARVVGPDLIQLHGTETPERARQIRARHGIATLKAIKVETAADARAALAYRGAADLILFDAKTPKGLAGALPGGNGLAFDWRALDEVRGEVRFMLSGGLTPDNVAEAIRLTGAGAVDVSSGVETAPGIKDADLVARFIRAAKGASS